MRFLNYGASRLRWYTSWARGLNCEPMASDSMTTSMNLALRLATVYLTCRPQMRRHALSYVGHFT